MGALVMTVDERDPYRLHLRGDPSGSDRRGVLDAAIALLAASPSQITVDVGGVTGASRQLVALLDDLARHAEVLGRRIVLEVPDDAEWLADSSLSSSIRVERTRLVRRTATRLTARLPAPPRASDGTPRREGRGFVASYGDGRRCAAVGCATTLSRYNRDERCWLHSPDTGNRRG